MGEKPGPGGDNKAKPDGKKNGPLTIVLKVDMHCDGCAKKIKRCVRGFDGVEMVTADVASGKLTAVGKIDPWKLRDHVEAKTHKKVVLVSPTDAHKNKEEKRDADKDKEKGGAEKKKEDKGPKEVTVVLKIRLHCQGCIKRIRRTIYGFQGVDSVSVDGGTDQVTVKGTMDVKAMVWCLQEKLKRRVETVQPKKDDGGGGGKGGGEEKAAKAAETNKVDHLFGGYGGGGGAGELMYAASPNLSGHAGYHFLQHQTMQQQQTYGFPSGHQQLYPVFAPLHHMPHPPQIFSDENPNACSVM